MKSTIILALASSTLAVPFGNVIDAMFGTNMEARHDPHPEHVHSFYPIHSGSGTGHPFRTMTGPCPTASGGKHHEHGTHSGHHPKSTSLAIDYELAPTAVPKMMKRQDDTASISSLTLLNPSDAVPGVPESTASQASLAPSPTAEPEEPEDPVPTDDPASPLPKPTEDPESPPPFPRPTGHPTGPFPTGGYPHPTGGYPGTGHHHHHHTTLHTRTREHRVTPTHGPRPTAQPEMPTFSAKDDEKSSSDGEQSWADWLEERFAGPRGNGRSEVQN